MSSTAQITVTAIADDTTNVVQRMDANATIDPILSVNGVRQTVALAAGFNTISVPSGANMVMIKVISGASALTLKGVTGDTGIVIQSSAAASLPVLLPLGASPSLGITAGGAVTIDVMFL